MTPKSIAFAIFLIASSDAHAQSAPSASQEAVRLHVTDRSGAEIGKAQIRVTAKPILLETDANGMALFTLPSFRFMLKAQSPGFAPLTAFINGGESQLKTLSLTVDSCPPNCATFPHSALYLYKSPQPEGEKILSYEPSEFARLPHRSVTVTDAQTHKKKAYSGVLLSALMTLIQVPHSDNLRGLAWMQYIVATGQGGPCVIIPLAETDPNFYPGVVLIADTLDGKPPSAREGPFQLILSQDRLPSRWVRNLNTIELRQAE